MANGSLANGKAKSPTPATNPIGKPFNKNAYFSESQKQRQRRREPERVLEREPERATETLSDSGCLSLTLSHSLWLSLPEREPARARESHRDSDSGSL